MLSTKPLVRSLAIAAVVGIGVLAAIATPAMTASAEPSCSDATLKGTYTFALDGWDASGSDTTPFALAGVETYDGAGNVAGAVTISLNGVITPRTPNTGVYHVDPDCTGTAAYTNSGVTTHFDIYVSPKGNSFKFVGTDTGQIAAGTEIRVSK